MRIIVVGGSNSIIHDGYVGRLRAARPDLTIVNRSAGSVSSMMGFARLFCFGPLNADDVVIWEYALNDEHEIAVDRAMNVGLALKYVELTLRHALRAGARFLPVIFRPRVFANSEVYSLYRLGLVDLFDRYGILAVDANALYAESHGGADIPREDYRDPWHFAASCPAPALVAERLVALLSDPELPTGYLPPPCLAPPDGYVQVVKDFEGLTPETYENSLISERLWRPEPEDREIFRPRGRVWDVVGAVSLATLERGGFILGSGKGLTGVGVRHRHSDFRKSLLALRVFHGNEYLSTSPSRPVLLKGTARPPREGLPRPRPLPADTGLVALILERPYLPRTLLGEP